MSRTDPTRRRELWGLLFVTAALVSGCSSVLSGLPERIGGLPEGAPARAETPPDFPEVHAMPPKRSQAVLSAKEREQVEADLAAARDDPARRATESAAKPETAKPKPRAVARTRKTDDKAGTQAEAEAR